MGIELLDAALKSAQAKSEKDGWTSFPEGSFLTLYLARGGATLNVPKVCTLKLDSELVFARTAKRETFVVSKSDVLAVAWEGGEGAPTRRPGFG